MLKDLFYRIKYTLKFMRLRTYTQKLLLDNVYIRDTEDIKKWVDTYIEKNQGKTYSDTDSVKIDHESAYPSIDDVLEGSHNV